MRKKKGFALIEMLVVVGIVSVLTGVTIPAVNNATVKASAATNAANLRAVQSVVQMQYLQDPDSFGNDTIAKAVEEVLTFNGTFTTKAPGAKGLRVGDVEIEKGTQMLVRLQSDNSVIATYDGFTMDDFSQIAGSGSLDDILSSLPDGYIDDLLGRLDEINSGYQPDTGYQQSTGYDPLFLTDMERMAEKVAELLAEGRLESDCKTCTHQGTVCSGYYQKRTEDGKGYLCLNCGHTPGVHSTTVLFDMADRAASVMTCNTGSIHMWGEDHKCTSCGMEYLFTFHIYKTEDSLNCEVCGTLHRERACAQGLHIYSSDGICTGCGELPPEDGPCSCTSGEIAGMYCARCGHQLTEHDLSTIMTGVIGPCGHGHETAEE